MMGLRLVANVSPLARRNCGFSVSLIGVSLPEIHSREAET
jgi:hypothetical protein